MTSCIAPSAATVSGGVQVEHENCPAFKSSSSGFASSFSDDMSVFHVPSMLAAPAGAAAFSPEAAFPVVACLHPLIASNEAAASAAQIALCIGISPSIKSGTAFPIDGRAPAAPCLALIKKGRGVVSAA